MREQSIIKFEKEVIPSELMGTDDVRCERPWMAMVKDVQLLNSIPA